MEDSWLTRLQGMSPTLKVGVTESCNCKGGRTFLLGLLGPTEAGPLDDDGWFASDFALAHLLYGGIVDEQCWLTVVDLLEEVEAQGPYLWGHPKEGRTVVFSKDDSKFYTVCNSEGLIAEFKKELQKMTASMGVEDRLLLLIFAHGEFAGSSGILVGADSDDVASVLTAEEVNDLLEPLSGGPPVTIISSACYSGVWHEGMPIGTRVAASTRDEESLSFPESDSRGCRGGYFWGGVWYELSRLGVWVAGESIAEDDTFRRWSENVKQRVQDMFLFHPSPTVSVSEEGTWNKHAKEVLCYNTEGDNVSSSYDEVPPNPKADSVANPDIYFTGAHGKFLRIHSTGGYKKFLGFPLQERLPYLMHYLSTCNIGLPNAASNIGVFRLAGLYEKGLASKEQLARLDMLLSYRVFQDWQAERILSFLRISRVCSIYKFKQWKNRGLEISPYLHVVNGVMPFDDPPKMTPRAYRYTKPAAYVAWTAYMAKVDVEWLNTNLRLYVRIHSFGARRKDGSSSGAGERSGESTGDQHSTILSDGDHGGVQAGEAVRKWRVVNQDLRPARQHARERVVDLVQRQMPDWLADLPEATRANAHLLIIWPTLDYAEDNETE